MQTCGKCIRSHTHTHRVLFSLHKSDADMNIEYQVLIHPCLALYAQSLWINRKCWRPRKAFKVCGPIRDACPWQCSRSERSCHTAEFYKSLLPSTLIQLRSFAVRNHRQPRNRKQYRRTNHITPREALGGDRLRA